MSGKNEEDDVLNFLDSLPSDQKGSAGARQNSSGSNNDNSGDNSDILDFLDELAQESNTTSTSLKPVKNIGSVTPKEVTTIPGGETATPDTKVAAPKVEKKEPARVETIKEVQSEQEQELKESANGKDPVSSISGWWGTSGSKQLNSFWGSASHVVGDLSKTAQSTYQDISKVANDQLKDLHLLDDEDYENLPETIKQKSETLSKNIDTSNPINKVGGLFSSFVSTINEQIISTTKTINSHDEVLKVFIINDQLKNFNYIDYLIYNKFHRVINQVEGSIDLEIVNSKNFSKLLNILDLASLTNKDNDLKPKQIDFFRGNVLDAEKLAFANIDDGIKTLMQLKKKEKEEKKAKIECGELDEEQQKATGNVSHIFLNILPVVQDRNIQTYSSSFEEIVKIDESNTESFQFLITLKDLEHKFSIVTKSQPFPLKWARWLITNSVNDKKAEKKGPAGEEQSSKEAGENTEDDGIEPADWVKEWIKDGLALSFGVLAQSYVTKRMGL